MRTFGYQACKATLLNRGMCIPMLVRWIEDEPLDPMFSRDGHVVMAEAFCTAAVNPEDGNFRVCLMYPMREFNGYMGFSSMRLTDASETSGISEDRSKRLTK